MWVPPHGAGSLSPGVHDVLTAYGEEPWTCSREYWRLYFGMECAELLSFNIRGLQNIPKQHRSHRTAGSGSRASPPPGRAHRPIPKPGNLHPPRGTRHNRGQVWVSWGQGVGVWVQRSPPAQRNTPSPRTSPWARFCKSTEQRCKSSGLRGCFYSPWSHPALSGLCSASPLHGQLLRRWITCGQRGHNHCWGPFHGLEYCGETLSPYEINHSGMSWDIITV